jgi:hypothetical protein
METGRFGFYFALFKTIFNASHPISGVKLALLR